MALRGPSVPNRTMALRGRQSRIVRWPSEAVGPESYDGPPRPSVQNVVVYSTASEGHRTRHVTIEFRSSKKRG